jgi:uncharacterized membrane protein
LVSGLFGTFLQIFEWVFEAVGTTIMIYGGLRAVFRLFICGISKRPYRLEDIRKEFTNKILFGLEFYIIVAVFITMKDPSTEDLVSLGAIVFIRTVLGYFLSKEIKEYKFD